MTERSDEQKKCRERGDETVNAEGVTQDSCEVNWEQAQTVEGDVVDQCVAYCPWQ